MTSSGSGPAASAYSLASKRLHWLTVVLVVLAWTSGTFGDDIPAGAAAGAVWIAHFAVGLAVLAVVAARISRREKIPPPPPRVTRFGSWLIAATDPVGRPAQLLLYALLVVVPLLGVVILISRGHTLPQTGIPAIPWPPNATVLRDLVWLHGLAANLLVALILFHVAAVLLHHFAFGDRTLARMLPEADAPEDRDRAGDAGSRPGEKHR